MYIETHFCVHSHPPSFFPGLKNVWDSTRVSKHTWGVTLNHTNMCTGFSAADFIYLFIYLNASIALTGCLGVTIRFTFRVNNL